MAAIKGWFYLLMGAIMIASSQLIKYEDGTKPLRVFLYIGILFVIIGIGKYVTRRSTKEGLSPNPMNQAMDRVAGQDQVHQQRRAQHRAHSNQMSQHGGLNQQQPTNFFKGQHEVHTADEQPVQHASIIACPMCGTRHYDYAHYCMKCGTRIKNIRN